VTGKIDYWFTADSFDRVEASLRRTIGQHATRSRWIYIGLTQQRPEVRFRQHQRLWADADRWDRMIVLYRARSLTLMHQVEDRLIRYARQQIDRGHYACKLFNACNSALPPPAYHRDGYWVYLLTAS
jgi:hypothetical protein